MCLCVTACEREAETEKQNKGEEEEKGEEKHSHKSYFADFDITAPK